MAWMFAIAMMTSVDPCVPCLPRSRPRPANPDVPPAGGLCSGCGQRRVCHGAEEVGRRRFGQGRAAGEAALRLPVGCDRL